MDRDLSGIRCVDVPSVSHHSLSIRSHPVQTEFLYQTAMEYAGLQGKESVIDAYCGIGTIGMVAAKQAKHVSGDRTE